MTPVTTHHFAISPRSPPVLGAGDVLGGVLGDIDEEGNGWLEEAEGATVTFDVLEAETDTEEDLIAVELVMVEDLIAVELVMVEEMELLGNVVEIDVRLRLLLHCICGRSKQKVICSRIRIEGDIFLEVERVILILY